MDKVQVSLLLIMVSCASIGVIVNTMDSENKTIGEKMYIVQKGESSNDPVMKKQAELARAELIELQSEKEAEEERKAERAKLKPYEKPETWLFLLMVIGSIIALPILFRNSKGI